MPKFKTLILSGVLLLIAGTGVYSSFTLNTVLVTLNGLEPRIEYMGTTNTTKWQSAGGLSHEVKTTKGDCSPAPACPSETDAEHAARHKRAVDGLLAVYPSVP